MIRYVNPFDKESKPTSIGESREPYKRYILSALVQLGGKLAHRYKEYPAVYDYLLNLPTDGDVGENIDKILVLYVGLGYRVMTHLGQLGDHYTLTAKLVKYTYEDTIGISMCVPVD